MLVLGVGLFRPLSSSSADHACTKVQKWWKQGEEALPLEKKSVLHSQRCPQAHAMPAIYWTPWTVVISKPETTGSSSLWISCSFIRGKGAYASLKGDTKIPPALLLLPRRMLVALSSDASGTALLFAAQVRTCCHVAMLPCCWFHRFLHGTSQVLHISKVWIRSRIFLMFI